MYIGIDLGTSGVKVLLMTDTQSIIASAHTDLTVQRPHAGWSEQHPSDWITAVDTTMRKLASSHPSDMARVQGIGLSGHMHGATLLDSKGTVLRPCMMWNDTRAHKEAQDLDAIPAFRALTGNIVFPGFTAPKVLWVRRNEPEIFSRCAKILLPKDYLRFWLTGIYASEMSDAAGTSWLDVAKRDWSDGLLSETGLTCDHMPKLVEGSDVSGHLLSELAAAWGIQGTPVVAGGAGDNAATAIGAGIVQSGQGFVSLGTSGVLFAATDKHSAKPDTAVHAFCHALPDRWHHMGVILSAADALNWHGRIMGRSAQTLVSELGDRLLAPTSVRFLPYLSGERTPHNDAHVRGSFHGLSHDTTAAHMTQAVLEGVAFALCDNQAALKNIGSHITTLLAMGGGSNSDYWLSLIATVLNCDILRPADGDFGASFGAARLGLMAHTGARASDICTMPTIGKRFAPNKELRSAFEDAYREYKALYLSQTS